MIYPRDFAGYGEHPPDPQWPQNARVAVSFVLNIEEGAELSLSAGDERNEGVYEIVDEVKGAPDPCMESHFEYGTRAGFWRILRLLDRYQVKATFSVCARSLEISPWMAQAAIARGHEISAHGYRWESPVHLAEDQERAMIARTVETITRISGQAPVGWHSRSASSVNTRRLLVEHGGFLYDSNAYNDDLPYLVKVADRPHVVLPYSFDTNDMRFTKAETFRLGSDFATYLKDSYDWLEREGGRMMSVGLHLRIIGRPGRIAGLECFLDHLQNRGKAWVARRDEIARHWRGLMKVVTD
jgi:peptidoglycan/xylan/chitin deacetylase (PgdA/CDA1 family)